MENMNKTEQVAAVKEVKAVLEKLGLTEDEIQDVLRDLQLVDES